MKPEDSLLACEVALQNLLPSREQTLLLVACLHGGDAASRAWTEFVDAVGDPKRFFESDQSGLKALLPYVETRLARNQIDAGKPFHTYARVALVREELRDRIYHEILETVLRDLESEGLQPILLKGGALAATVYPDLSVRHNHAIDLLVHEPAMRSAQDVLRRTQFNPTRVQPGGRHHRDYRHKSGLALALHTRVFYLPHFNIGADELQAHARVVPIPQAVPRIRVLCPEHTLVHVCGHATYARSRTNLRWVCDAFHLLERHPDLDWEEVVETAVQARLTLPLFVMLRWLMQALSAPVPQESVQRLRELSFEADSVASEAIFAATLHACTAPSRAFQYFRGQRRAAWGFIRFMIAPSPLYVRWRFNVGSNWTLPFYYGLRALRFAGRIVAGKSSAWGGQKGEADASRLSHERMPI